MFDNVRVVGTAERATYTSPVRARRTTQMWSPAEYRPLLALLELWMGYGRCTRTLYTIFRTPPSIEPTKMPSCPTADDDSVSAMPLKVDKILPVARSSTCRTPPVTPAPSLSQDMTTWTTGAQGERQLILNVKILAHEHAERKPHEHHVRQWSMRGEFVPQFGLRRTASYWYTLWCSGQKHPPNQPTNFTTQAHLKPYLVTSNSG